MRHADSLVPALLAACAFTTFAQTPFSPPRLSDGVTPDLRGIWQADGAAHLNIEGKGFITDPSNGKIPYRPDALAQRSANFKVRATADPSLKCAQAGVPRATYMPTPLQIVQSPGNFALAYQDVHAFRIVYLDGRSHIERIDWWMGDSRGRWEGDSLVVDVSDLNNETWFDRAGNHHSEDMRVIERYTLTAPDTLLYQATMTDPKTFTQPWTLQVPLRRIKEPGFRLIEDECLEDAKGVRHHVAH